MKRSELYDRALKAAQRHHRDSKTYSGSFARHHASQIRDVIELYGCETMLDFGAGKGEQYKWRVPPGPPHWGRNELLADYWGTNITLYDPAVEHLSEPVEGPFDIVICTHVLSTIPTQDLTSVVAELHALAGKVVFVAERLEEPKSAGAGKGPIAELGAENFPIQWTPDQWIEALHGSKPVAYAFRVPGREGYLQGWIR